MTWAPGEIVFGEGDIEINAGAAAHRAGRRQHRRPPGSGRQPRAPPAGQRRTGVRPRCRARPPARHSRRHRGAIRTRCCPAGLAGPAGRIREVYGLSLQPPGPIGRADDSGCRGPRYAALFGPTDRRPDPAGRHRSVHRDHRGSQWRTGIGGRRGGVRRRQGTARVDGAGPRHPRRRAHPTPSSPAR